MKLVKPTIVKTSISKSGLAIGYPVDKTGKWIHIDDIKDILENYLKTHEPWVITKNEKTVDLVDFHDFILKEIEE